LRRGGDVALLGIGRTVPVAQRAAELLAERGVRASVVDARYVKPLDAELICATARTAGCVVTIEDHAGLGGFGSAVLELLARELPRTAVRIHALPDRFTDHGEVNAQYRAAAIDPESIATETWAWLEALRRPPLPRRAAARGESPLVS